MDCRAARAALDQGQKLDPAVPAHAAVLDHLTSCSACRSYRDQVSQRLLQQLLTGATTPAAPAPPILAAPLLADLLASPPPRRGTPPIEPDRSFADARRWLGYLVLGLLAIVVLATLYIAGSTTFAMLQIQRNIEAMRPVTPTARSIVPTREPTIALPTNVDALLAAQATRVAAERASQPTVAAVPVSAVEPSPAPTHGGPSPTPPLSLGALPAGASPTITPVPLNPASAPGATPALAPLPTVRPGSVAERGPPAGSAITVLLMGIDRRPDESWPSRADSIMVARIEPERNRVALLSLPRDLIVNIPGYGYARINAAAVYGELYPELGGGVELTRQTVSELLGLPIDYAVHIDFMGFIQAIDSIGGIDVDVEKEIYDPQYPTMDYGYEELYFAPGPQHMDGATALKYGRTRHADSDWDRARRQQQILVGIANRLRAQGMLDRVQSVAALTASLRGYIQTDLPQDRMIGLAWAFRGIDPETVERYVLDGSMVATGVSASDPYAEYALPGTVEGLVNQLLNGP